MVVLPNMLSKRDMLPISVDFLRHLGFVGFRSCREYPTTDLLLSEIPPSILPLVSEVHSPPSVGISLENSSNCYSYIP
jgi:hypothetical protein